MIIIKHKTKDCFARIPNDLLADNSLKWRDKGLLSYLLGKPLGWKLQIKDLVARSRDGQDAVYSSLKSLINCGYCRRLEKRDASGKINGVEYYIADTPYFLTYESGAEFIDPRIEEAFFRNYKHSPDEETPHLENPDTVNPDTENPALNKNKVIKRNSNKNKNNESEELSLDIDEKDIVNKGAFPWAQVMSIFKRMRPDKIYRKNPRGVTERHMKSFWRRFNKSVNCFERLCEKINESDYLMGKGGFEGSFPSPNPNWSWVFGKTPNGDWRTDKIMSDDYSNDKLAFVLEKASTKKVYLVGKGITEVNLAEKLDNGTVRYQQIGEDEYSGKPKYADMLKATGGC